MTSKDHHNSVSRDLFLANICQHIETMLNSRQDYCPHIPEYGQPDLVDLYRKLPDAAAEIAESVHQAVRAFEPRLQITDFIVDAFDPDDFALRMHVTSELKADSSRTTLSISLSSQGRISVKVRQGASRG